MASLSSVELIPSGTYTSPSSSRIYTTGVVTLEANTSYLAFVEYDTSASLSLTSVGSFSPVASTAITGGLHTMGMWSIRPSTQEIGSIDMTFNNTASLGVSICIVKLNGNVTPGLYPTGNTQTNGAINDVSLFTAPGGVSNSSTMIYGVSYNGGTLTSTVGFTPVVTFAARYSTQLHVSWKPSFMSGDSFQIFSTVSGSMGMYGIEVLANRPKNSIVYGNIGRQATISKSGTGKIINVIGP